MDLNINKSTFVTNDPNELKNCNEETEIQQRDAKQRKKCKRNYKYQRVKDLKCGICPDILFTSEKEYLLHIRDEHEGKIIDSYMCNVCGKTFKTRSELVQHIKSKCGTERKFVCKECGQKLMSAGSLHNHMKRHKDSANFMCRFCAKLFLFAGQLKVHERIHTQEKDFVCEICGKGFCHRQSLITHISVHTGIKPYQCESCSKSFSCIGNLLKHRKSHKDTCGMTPLTSHRVQNPSTKIKVRINTPASSLLKKTERKRRLQEKFAQLDSKADDDEVIEDVAESEVEQDVDDVGEAISTSEDERVQKQTDMKPRKLRKRDPQLDANVSNFISERKLETGMTATCKYCAKEYTNFRWLYKHEKEHENCMNDGDFKCSCCRKGFESKQSLKEHQLQVHADVLTCHECVVDKIFSSIDSLKSHRDIFHNGIPRKEYTYVCEKCGKKFKQKSLLQVHNSTDCGSVPHFRCRVCDKDFSSYHSQKAHMRIHTGQKDLECKFCGKSFRWKGQLKVHERSHTGEKPYTCLFCPSAFAYRDSLITHSTIHTGIKPYLCKSCGWRFSCVGNLVKHKVTHASTCGAWYKENGEKS